MFDVPKDRKENLAFRKELILNCAKDVDLRAAVREYALRNIYFWFDALVWTYDPRVPPYHLPFILFDYQRERIIPEVIKAIETGYDLYIEKSRDVGLTESVPSGITLWYWLQNSSGNDFLLGSRKEDLVDARGVPDTIFEKIRYKIKHLPNWMLPEGYNPDKHDRHMKIVNPATGSVILGEANNKHFGTGARKKAVFYDEFPKWETTDHHAWTSCGDVTKCRIAFGTPFGMNNKAAELRYSGRIKVVRAHALERPDRDEEWYREEVRRRTPQELAQEIDISYEGSAGKRFFPNYGPGIHRLELKHNPDKEVLECWDFGYHHPAVLFTQKDEYDRWLWLHCIVGENVGLETFGRYVLKKRKEWFPGVREFMSVGDPAGNQVSDKTDETCITILAKLGIWVGFQRSPRVTRAKIMKLLLDHNIMGKPALLINAEEDDRYSDKKPGFIMTESMWHVHEGFMGGVRYSDNAEKQGKEDYEKDGLFDHIFDAAGYGAYRLYPHGVVIDGEGPFDTEKKPNKRVLRLIKKRENADAKIKEIYGARAATYRS